MATARYTTRLRSKSTTSAEQVAGNEDLLIEILLRLPTKNLLKMKLVSKPWLNLISSPYFGLAHTRFLHNIGYLEPKALFLDVIYTKVPSRFKFLRLNPHVKRLPPLDFIDTPRVRILQSCTGVLLCKSQSDHGSGYFICNPVIKKFKAISLPDIQLFDPVISTKVIVKDYKHVGVNLAFDPLKSSHYKILSIWRQEIEVKLDTRPTSLVIPKYFIDLYSSETDSWQVSKVQFFSNGDIKADVGVYLNGAIHWDCFRSDWVYFDVDNERLKTMPMPPTTPTDGLHSYFGESEGRLHLIVAAGQSLLRFSIFELQPDYSGWLAMYDINVDAERHTLVPRNRRYDLPEYLLSCAVNYDEETGDLKLLIVLPWGNLVSYNLEDGTVKRLKCSNVNTNLFDQLGRFRISCPYYETLTYIYESG